MNPSSLMPLLALVVVILAIPAVMWLLRRGGLGGVPQSGLLKQVACLSLSPSPRVVIVELSLGAQAQWLVLGALFLLGVLVVVAGRRIRRKREAGQLNF